MFFWDDLGSLHSSVLDHQRRQHCASRFQHRDQGGNTQSYGLNVDSMPVSYPDFILESVWGSFEDENSWWSWSTLLAGTAFAVKNLISQRNPQGQYAFLQRFFQKLEGSFKKRARSRLYRKRCLRVNIHFAAFFKIYKICALLRPMYDALGYPFLFFACWLAAACHYHT